MPRFRNAWSRLFPELFLPTRLCGDLWVLWAIYWAWMARFVQRTTVEESRARRLLHLLPTVLGFYLIFYAGGAVLGGAVISWTGVALTGAALIFAVWARRHLGRYWSGIITLKEGHRLIETGPYRWVRHPIYTGFIAATLGSALAADTRAAYGGYGVIAVAYVMKLKREEFLLGCAFGNEYLNYKKRTAALVPFVF